MSFAPLNDTVSSVQDYTGKRLKGKVVNNLDPLKQFRIQVSVPGLYEPDQGDVPWVGPNMQSVFGIGPGFGWYGVPQIGADVIIELQDGDIHHPMYTGHLYVAGSKDDDYGDPNVWGFKDVGGNKLRVDTSAHTWNFETGTGYVFNVDGGGKLTITAPSDADVTVAGNANVNVGGNANLQVGGTATYKAAVHQFQGPIVTDSTIAAGADITDRVSLGNSKTVGNMREVYDIHGHNFVDSDGDTGTTEPPNEQI